jgi:hypothetical protein
MTNNLVDEIKEKGIVKIEHFLEKEEIENITKIIRYYSAPKGHVDSQFVISAKSLLANLLKFKFLKIKQSYNLISFQKKKGLKKIAEDYFDKETQLYTIDGYYSKKDKKDILPWHTDQAYSGERNIVNFVNPNNFFLKFFIFLTDVTPGNGCVSYISRSHKIAYAIRDAIYKKKIQYQPYWNLIDFRKIIFDNKEYFFSTLNKNKLLDEFLDQTQYIENNVDTDKYDYSAKAGTIVIFDEGGVHRGTKATISDRMVLRYFYSLKKK